MKKVLSVLLALVIILGTIPGMSFAVGAEDEPSAEPEAETITISKEANSGTMSVTLTVLGREPVSYIDADGTQKQTGPNCYDVYPTDTSLGIKSTEQWYVVREDITLVTADSLRILGDLRLILGNGATLTVPHGFNLDNGSITIYGQSNDAQTMGKLIANAHGDDYAAIGSTGSKAPGGITINGGNITATGSLNGSAIGGGKSSKDFRVTINGGVINANGGTNGSAIGGGAGSTNVNVIVNGGTVHATGGENGAAIIGNLTVNGGSVTVDGSANNAALSGNLTVNGGTVIANGSANNAAFGGNLTFNGGAVTATGTPALSGSAKLASNAFAKAGESAATAVNTDANRLKGKKYIQIVYTPVYTITWKNYNGTVLCTTTVLEGETPTTWVTPEKPSDAQGDYCFAGWSPAVVAATADATYTATFKPMEKLTISQGQYIRLGYYNGHPVDWYCQRVNGTGTMMLCKYALKSMSFGSNATYKTSNVHAWLDVDSGGSIARDLGLTDTELSFVRTVNLSSNYGDGTDSFILPSYDSNELNKGQKVQAPYRIGTNTLVPIYWLRTPRDGSNARVINHSKDGSPVATVAARYSGVGNSQWVRPMFYLDTNAIKDAKYIGSGTEDDPYVFVTRYDLRGKIIYPGGTVPIPEAGKINVDVQQEVSYDWWPTVYNGEPPTKAVGEAYIELSFTPNAGYTFKDFKVVADDGTSVEVWYDMYFTMPACSVTLIAEVEKVKYEVTWKNHDGTVLKTDSVEHGEKPEYTGATPVKAATEVGTYAFKGWTPAVAAITEATTYTAEYNIVTPNPAHFSQDGDVYTIHDSTGWEAFCDCLLDTATYNGFSGKTVVLGADITANRNAGSDTAQFKGTFDGQGHKTTANINGTSRAALFSTINGATIKNLVVDGSVTGGIHCAGLVSIATDGSTNTIENVAVNVAVTTTGSHCGGILGHGGKNTNNTLRGCVFTGSITGGTHVGVLYGWGGSSTPTIENCLEAGTAYTGTNVNPVGLISTWGTVKNTYYNNAIKGSPNQNTTRGLAVHTVTAGENVEVIKGESTVYDVSGITAYGTGIEYNGTFYAGEGDQITLSNTAPEGYVFKQYTVNAGTVEENTLTMPAEDVAVNVEFTKTYTVTWKNGEEVLEVDENVPENTVPTYDGETPVKADEDGITYIFAGWTPEVTAVTGDVTYTATFTGLTKVEAKEPAYTSAGNIEYYTGSDGKYYVKNGNDFIETTLEAVTIAQLVLVHHDAVAATCTQTGNIEYWQAEENDKYFSDANGEQEITLEATVVNALGHTFGEWVVTIEAQVGVKGEETHTCSVCGESETRITAALPYVPVTNGDGDKVYSETVTEEPQDVTELFAQAKAGDGTVEVHSDDYAIVFDSDAVSAIGDANVTLSVKVITEDLPENVPENAELVLEVTLLGATFEVGQAKVSIPLEGEVPEGKVARVYYVDDLGNKTDMNAVFENGIVTFTTNHFSTYVLVFEDEASSGTLHFSAASLTLQNNLKENFYVRKDMLVSGGFTDPYVVFSMNGRAVTVNEYSEVNSDDVDYYVFSFANIAPNQMNEEIKATLHATKDEADCVIEELTYSIASYCYSTLSKTKDAKLRTLLVDLLNYGAAAQTYTGYHIDALVNAELTAEQLAWGTAADPDLTSVKSSRYNEINNPSLLWKGVSLSLNDSITMQFVFTTESTEGVTVKVKSENGALLKEFSADEFTILGGYYIARLKVLTAGQMSDTVYVTAYCGDGAISNTFAYSIESYAYSKQNDSDENLADLVKAMMKYGNAARAYAT